MHRSTQVGNKASFTAIAKLEASLQSGFKAALTLGIPLTENFVVEIHLLMKSKSSPKIFSEDRKTHIGAHRVVWLYL